MKKMTLCLAYLSVFLPISSAQPAPTVDPKVHQVLDSMASFYKGLNTISCSYEMKIATEAQGKNEALTLDFSVIAERPNKISFIQSKSTAGVDVVSDGKSVAVSIPRLKKYIIEDAPDSIGSALEWGALNAVTQFNSIIGDLMGPDPASALLDGVSEAKYVGEEEIGSQKFHRIRLVQGELDVDMWIALGEKPFVTRLVPDVSKGIDAAETKVTIEVNLSEWTGNEPIPTERFAFAAPEGFEKATSFAALFGGEQKRPSDALIGAPAPAFTLNGLDGKSIDLKSYLGKNIVVLDFWATWCGPCVMSLPILSEVTDSFKDKGVVFIAVNQGEVAEDINAFLSEQKLNFTVALDTEQSVAGQYFVNGIPQTVVIGKSGAVEAVHVGVSPVLRQQLKSQLSALAAGRSLARQGT